MRGNFLQSCLASLKIVQSPRFDNGSISKETRFLRVGILVEGDSFLLNDDQVKSQICGLGWSLSTT